MRLSSRPLLPLLLALAMLGVGGTASAAGLEAEAEQRVLRLHDLPPGFQIGDDSGCGPLGIEGADPRVASWVAANRPEGCGFQYERIFAPPGPGVVPPLVESSAILTATEAGTVEGLALAPILASALTGHHSVPSVAPAPAIGQQARLFHSSDVGVQGRSRGNATFLFWRQGPVLLSLLVAGGAPSVNDTVIARLARLQQAHVEAPTPYTEAERDDTEVQLDNPRLSFPIHWIGRSFHPGHGLPATKLEYAYASNAGVGPPGDKARLEYSQVALDIWTRKSWRLYAASELGRQVTTWSCTRQFPVKLGGRRAVVFGGYAKDYRRCPNRPPKIWFAHAFLGSTVVGVDVPVCLISGFCGPESGPYSSLRGMKAVLRGLVVRPKPLF